RQCMTRRPCIDCRKTAPLECTGDRCGEVTRVEDFEGVLSLQRLCRPCAATWRVRVWSSRPRRQRQWLMLASFCPSLAALPLTPEQGGDLFFALNIMARRAVRHEADRLADELADTLTNQGRK